MVSRVSLDYYLVEIVIKILINQSYQKSGKNE